jgi:hypothetical protein
MGLKNSVPFKKKVRNYRSKIKYMKKKSYVIQYLIKYTKEDEKTIRKLLLDFWKRYPDNGLDGICGYIINGRWEHRNHREVALEVLHDVQKAGKEYNEPFTQRYWVVMTDNYRLRNP